MTHAGQGQSLTQRKRLNRRAVQIALLCAAVLLVTLGVARGEPGALQQKTRVVCLACIGVGP